MLNQAVIVGRIIKEPELKKTEKNKGFTSVNLAVQRSYKNEEGIYETDFVNVRLYNGIATTTAEYCRKGDLIGIRGRIETSYENNGQKNFVVADKITFLSAQKSKDNDVEIN